MSRLLVVLALTSLVSGSVLACSAMRPGGDPFARATGGEDAERLSIQVVNRSYYDATVHARSLTRRVRLGITPSTTTRTFPIDWEEGPQELRAEIDRLAGGRFVTAPIMAHSGERVTLIIEPRLEDSYLRN